MTGVYTDVYLEYGAAMSRFGVDYSFSPPTVAQLKSAGVTFCCRYVGIPSSGKNLTLVEADALQHAGIDLVANYEGTKAGWMAGGRTAGVNAAKAAHADAVRLGMPAGRPIYFSADYNATFDQYKTQIKPCLEGAASVIGTSRVGLYGGLEQVDWAYGDGVAPWVWQTYAWSYGTWSKHSRIQQYRNGQTLGSGTVDYDRAIVTDFGQWRAPEEEILTQEEHDALLWLRANAATHNDAAVIIRGDETTDPTKDTHPDNLQRLRQDLAAGLSDVSAKLAAVQQALSSGMQVTLTQAQLDEIKAAIQVLEGSALVQLAVSPAP